MGQLAGFKPSIEIKLGSRLAGGWGYVKLTVGFIQWELETEARFSVRSNDVPLKFFDPVKLPSDDFTRRFFSVPFP